MIENELNKRINTSNSIYDKHLLSIIISTLSKNRIINDNLYNKLIDYCKNNDFYDLLVELVKNILKTNNVDKKIIESRIISLYSNTNNININVNKGKIVSAFGVILIMRLREIYYNNIETETNEH